MNNKYLEKRINEKIHEIKSKRITNVDLRGYIISELPQNLLDCDFIEKLDLSAYPYIDNSSIYLSEEYWWEVGFDQNQLVEIDEGIGKLKNLNELNISQNFLISLPNSIGELKELRKLFLRNNNLKSLPSTIGKLENLEVLDVSYNQLLEIPKEIGELKNLKELYINSNMLKSLPAEIGNLSNLEKIDIGNFDSERIFYETVERFNLKRNHFRGLPKNFSKLNNLKELNIFYDALPKKYEEWYEWSLEAFMYMIEENSD